MSKFSLCTLLGLTISLIAFSGLATAHAPAAEKTVTGCLQKGIEPTGGFYLITSDGHHLELYDGGSASLADHVGQEVSVTGTVPKRSAEQEKASQPYEKQETGKNKHSDFEVSSLKVVNQTCSK